MKAVLYIVTPIIILISLYIFTTRSFIITSDDAQKNLDVANYVAMIIDNSDFIHENKIIIDEKIHVNAMMGKKTIHLYVEDNYPDYKLNKVVSELQNALKSKFLDDFQIIISNR